MKPKLNTSNPAIPRLVLDTNVLLDWWVFNDSRCAALASNVLQGAAVWVATPAMRDELEHVLGRGTLAAWRPDPAALRARWDRWALTVEAPPAGPPGAPQCTDRDDQKFIDLGLHIGAHALLSRDRALLRCARKARSLGLRILTPQDWAGA